MHPSSEPPCGSTHGAVSMHVSCIGSVSRRDPSGLPRGGALYTIIRFLPKPHEHRQPDADQAPHRCRNCADAHGGTTRCQRPRDDRPARPAGRRHRHLGPHLSRLHRRRARCRSGAAQLLQRAGSAAVPEIDLHVGQPRRLSWHTVAEQGPEAGRHPQHRRHGDQRRLSRRHQQDVLRRRAERTRRTAGRGDAAVPV